MSLCTKKYLIISIAIAMIFSTTIVTGQQTDEPEPQDVEIDAGGDIETKYEWHTHLLYESRYITEGRDNLAGNGIYSVSTEFTYKDLSIVPWIAEGADADYSEFNLNIVYAAKLDEDFEISTGYNYLASDQSGNKSNDNEISLDLAYFFNEQVRLNASLYYSFDAEGVFAEIGIRKRYQYDNDLALNIGAIVGLNAGYVADGHDGVNHAQLKASVSYQLMKHVEVYAFALHSIAIDEDAGRYTGDEFLRDESWVSTGLSYRF